MITIRTNHVPRFTVYGFDLTDEERKEFDYFRSPGDTDEDFNEALDCGTFFRYKGWVYDLGEAVRINRYSPEEFEGWDGYYGETYFSGVLVKLVDAGEKVIVGQYFS